MGFRKVALIAYFLVLAVHVVFRQWPMGHVGDFSKVLLMPLLFLSLEHKKWLVWPLLFSWLGDILLLWDNYFLYGLGAFLIAHKAYIFFLRKNVVWNPWVFFGLLAYFFLLFPSLLLPKLTAAMHFPVLLYAVILLVMTAMALSQHGENKKYIALGAVLFTLSDSMLALNKFHEAIPYASVYVMLTYGLGQYFLVRGLDGES